MNGRKNISQCMMQALSEMLLKSDFLISYCLASNQQMQCSMASQLISDHVHTLHIRYQLLVDIRYIDRFYFMSCIQQYQTDFIHFLNYIFYNILYYLHD